MGEATEEAVQHHEKFVREEREQGKSCGSRTTERKRDTMTATVQSVREVARRVVAARVAGMHMLRIGDSLFNLSEEGMCLRFVRKVHEAALDQAEQTWAYRAQYAIYADYLLRRAGLECSDPESADVVCFNRWKPETARPGHIAVYLGDGMCAENTVSSKRGTPRVAGTKFSHLDEVDPDGSRRMFFRTVPMQTAALLRTDCVPIITMDSRILTVGKIEVSAAGNDVLMAPVRQLLEGLGHTVNADHLAAQGKCYIA
jgi:hypothetical protein